jgi:Spaetzle
MNITSEISVVNRFINNIATPSNRTRRQTDVDPVREQLCAVRTNYINPKAALNVRTGNWMYIVNGGEMATQLVRTEICL